MNKFILLLLVVLSSIPTLAQEEDSGDFDQRKGRFIRIEIIGGPSITSIKYSYLLPSDKQVNTFGFAVGLGTSYII